MVLVVSDFGLEPWGKGGAHFRGSQRGAKAAELNSYPRCRDWSSGMKDPGERHKGFEV